VRIFFSSSRETKRLLPRARSSAGRRTRIVHARDADQQPYVEGKVAGLGPVVAPPRPQPVAVRNHHQAEQEDDGSNADLHGPRRTPPNDPYRFPRPSPPSARRPDGARGMLAAPATLIWRGIPLPSSAGCAALPRAPLSGFIVLAVQGRLVERGPARENPSLGESRAPFFSSPRSNFT